MITDCRDDPNVKWALIKMAEGAPASADDGGSRALLDWAKSRAAKAAGAGLDRCVNVHVHVHVHLRE